MDEQEEREEKYRRLRASERFKADMNVLEVMLADFKKAVDEFSEAVEKNNAD